MNTQSTQRFVSDVARPLGSTPHPATSRIATQRFVSDNDDSPCRNSTLLDLPHRLATSFNSTQRFVSYIASLLVATSRASAPLTAPQHLSTQRFVSDAAPLLLTALRCTTFRNAPQLNDLLVTPHRSAPRQYAAQLPSTQLNDLLVTPQRVALQLRTALLASTQLNDLLVTTTSRRRSPQRVAPQLTASQLFSTQRYRLIKEYNHVSAIPYYTKTL